MGEGVVISTWDPVHSFPVFFFGKLPLALMLQQILAGKNSEGCYNKSDQVHDVVNMKRANSKKAR